MLPSQCHRLVESRAVQEPVGRETKVFHIAQDTPATPHQLPGILGWLIPLLGKQDERIKEVRDLRESGLVGIAWGICG